MTISFVDTPLEIDDDLPILTEIVQTATIPSDDDLQEAQCYPSKSVPVPFIPIQPSKINFLNPLKHRRKTGKLHAFSRSDFDPEPAPLVYAPPPTPPSGETRIAVSPFQPKIVLSEKMTQEESEPTLLGLFDENAARDQERQILRLAEERARHQVEEAIKLQQEALQESLLEEVMKILPTMVSEQVQAQKENLLKNSLKRLPDTLAEHSKKNTFASNETLAIADDPIYRPESKPLPSETRISEEAPPLTAK